MTNTLTENPTVPSPILLNLLRRFEGLHRIGRDGLVYPYICPAGFATQGYGRLVPSMAAPPISTVEAEAWLAQDAAKHLRLALGLSPNLAFASDERRSAIASFVFNLGSGRYKASTLRRCVNAEDWEGAAEQIKKWIWGGGKKLPGLVLRREAEAVLLS